MKYLKIACLTTGLLVSANVLSDGFPGNPADPATVATAQTGAGSGGSAASNAKDNCKKLGGKWKPIRKICKIDSIVNKDL